MLVLLLLCAIYRAHASPDVMNADGIIRETSDAGGDFPDVSSGAPYLLLADRTPGQDCLQLDTTRNSVRRLSYGFGTTKTYNASGQIGNFVRRFPIGLNGADKPAASAGAPMTTLPPRPTRHHIKAVLVSFSGANACGTVANPQDCRETCSSADVDAMLISGERSVANFFRTATRGLVDLSAEYFSVTAPPMPETKFQNVEGFFRSKSKSKVGWDSIWPKNQAKRTGTQAGTFLLFIFPFNWLRVPYNAEQVRLGNLTGGPRSTRGLSFSVQGGSTIWMAGCDVEGLLHEFGHSLGLSHSGAVATDFRTAAPLSSSFNPYYDISSVMSVAIPQRLNPTHNPAAWRGLTALQLFHLGVLSRDNIWSVFASGTYKFNSLSRNAVTGYSAVRITMRANLVYWVEWREAVNQDRDLTFSLCTSTVSGPLTGTMLVHHVVTDGTSSDGLVTQLDAIIPLTHQWFDPTDKLRIVHSAPGEITVTMPNTTPLQALALSGRFYATPFGAFGRKGGLM